MRKSVKAFDYNCKKYAQSGCYVETGGNKKNPYNTLLCFYTEHVDFTFLMTMGKGV